MKISRPHYFTPAPAPALVQVQAQQRKKPDGRNHLWVLIVSVFITCVCVSTIAKATEQTDESFERTTAPGEVQSGTLLFPSSQPGRYIRASLLETSVHIGVQGMLARTLVNQRFTNQTNDWTEAVYVFPLPDNASVDDLTMTIAGRQIKGTIQTKRKAKQTYKTAKAAGKKTSLLEQQRANLFTTRVANIPPGESINIQIAYQSSVTYSDGQFELYFPLTITPRYIPGTPKQYNADDLFRETGNGWALPTDQVSDANEITPPMTDKAAPVSIEVSLDTGLEIAIVNSNSHSITTNRLLQDAGRVIQVSLSDETIPADRDFTLSWSPKTGHVPVASVFRQDVEQTSDTQSFASLMLMPPQNLFNGSRQSREVIFVIDTSQSMSGTSIVQARNALSMGIDRLNDRDVFNIIEFDSHSRTLFSSALKASDANKSRAIDWVKQLYADNGTEIMGAMRAALQKNGKKNTGEKNPEVESIRQIIFITDGSVGNEDEIFNYVQKNIGDDRLFTVGIGSAPNTWFMRKAAELGRGSFVTINNPEDLADKMSRLFAKLEHPVLTNIEIEFNTDAQPEVFPLTLPDVYMGEPVLADARWDNRLDGGDVTIIGQYNGAVWSQKISLSAPSTDRSADKNPVDTAGLDKLWAYRKISSLEDRLLFGADSQATQDAITQVALDYSLVTRYTSLVAVEEKISRPKPINAMTEGTTDTTGQQLLKTQFVPLAMPSGNTMLFPQGSLDTKLKFLVSFGLTFFTLLFSLVTLRRKPECPPIRLNLAVKAAAVG